MHADTRIAAMLDDLPELRQAAVMPTGTTRDVGAEIRAEMGRQRISMLKLSAATQIPRTTLADQVNRNRLSVESLLAIAKALNVDPSQFLPESEAASA